MYPYTDHKNAVPNVVKQSANDNVSVLRVFNTLPFKETKKLQFISGNPSF